MTGRRMGPACAEKHPSHWKEMLGGMTDSRTTIG